MCKDASGATQAGFADCVSLKFNSLRFFLLICYSVAARKPKASTLVCDILFLGWRERQHI